MKLSVLIRGHNHLEKDRFGFSMDARYNAKSIADKLINPVRRIHPEAKIFLATYDSPGLQEIQEILGPCQLIPIDPTGSSQAETYKTGLKHVFDNDDCDALIVTRFDLDFKKSFPDWGIDISNSTVFFPWKEYIAYWRDHRRVGDAVHVIGRKSMSAFYNSIIMTQLANRNSLHLLYYFLRTLIGDVKYIEEGYWDSNTMFAEPEFDNPLYKIFNRPKSDVSAPFNGYQFREIRGE